jgi:hypothetical protein
MKNTGQTSLKLSKHLRGIASDRLMSHTRGSLHLFSQRTQQTGECFDDFLADTSSFTSAKKLTLDEAIDMCKTAEATSRRLRVIRGTLDEVKALGHASTTTRIRRRSKSGTRRSQAETSSDADIATVSMRQATNRAQHLTTVAVDARSCITSRKYANHRRNRPLANHSNNSVIPSTAKSYYR